VDGSIAVDYREEKGSEYGIGFFNTGGAGHGTDISLSVEVRNADNIAVHSFSLEVKSPSRST